MSTVGQRPTAIDEGRAIKRAKIDTTAGDQETTVVGSFRPLSMVKQGDGAELESVADTVTSSRMTSQRPKKCICEFAGCGKAFDRPVRLQAHQRTHTGDRPYSCQEAGCPKAFFKAEHLKAHIRNKHCAESAYTCTYRISTNDEGEEFECGKSFTTGTRLRRHIAAHEEKEHLKCQEPGCSRVFRKIETFQRHIKQDHLHEKAFRCTHSSFENGMEEFRECGLDFSTLAQLNAHTIREHTGLRYFCEICSDSLRSQMKREQTAEELETIEELPSVGFKTFHELQAHNRSAHPPKCETCGKTCESKRALAAHADIEHSSLSERQKYPCLVEGCDRVFTRQGNLKVHVQNVHAKRKRFVCGQYILASNNKCPGWDGDGCGMAFSTKVNLENHTRIEHLGLPGLVKRRSKTKPQSGMDTANAASPADPDEPNELEELAEGDSNALALLTGYGYDKARPLPCWAHDCPVRFIRSYDLAQHMELAHGWLVDDINDRLAENEALAGGRFWIGGSDGFARIGDEANEAPIETHSSILPAHREYELLSLETLPSEIQENFPQAKNHIAHDTSGHAHLTFDQLLSKQLAIELAASDDQLMFMETTMPEHLVALDPALRYAVE